MFRRGARFLSKVRLLKSLPGLLLIGACSGAIQRQTPTLVSDFANLVDLTYERSLSAVTYDLEFTAKPSTGTRDIVASATSSNTSLIPDPTLTLISESTGQFKLTLAPVAGQTGTATITVTALLGSLSGEKTFTVTITPPNTAPTISDVSDETVNEDVATSALAITVGDSETAVASLTLSGTSSNTTLVPNGNIVFGGSGASRTVTVTPAANQNGTATITLTVSDGSLTATDTFLLTVTAQNDAPTISSIADQSTNEDTALGPISFTIGDVETAAGSLSLSASSSNTTVIPNGNITLGGSGTSRTITLTPAANESGTTTITIQVGDGTATTNETFDVVVNAVNDAPTVTAIADQSIAVAGNTGAIAFTIGDVETAAGSLTLSGSSSNTTVIPNGNIVFGGSGANRTVTVTGAASQVGIVTVTVGVSDGTTTTNETLAVTVGSAPSALSYARNYILVSPLMTPTISLSPTVTGIVSSYAISPALPTGVTINTNTGVISGKPSVTHAATLHTITATNAIGSTTTQVTVESLNAFYVDTTDDDGDSFITDGNCININGYCSLRAAVEEINGTTSGVSNIIIPAGTTTNVATNGAISINYNMNIIGEVATTSIVSGGNSTRIFALGATNLTIGFKRLSIINGDRAGGEGAAIYTSGGTITVDQVRFTGNTADSASAIYIEDAGNSLTANLTITKSYFGSNTSSMGAGAIYFDGTTLTVEDTSFVNNTAGGDGGAIYTIGGTTSFARNTFESNSGVSGGAISFTNGTSTLINNTFYTNITTGVGGAVYQSGNTSITATNNTFARNIGAGGGGAFALAITGNLTLKNNAFENNEDSGNNPTDCNGFGTVTSTGYNLTNHDYGDSNCGLSSGTNDIVATASFGALANNGGYVQTLSIGSGSPLEDMGTNTGCPATDARGTARSDGQCDIGAYER